MKKLAIFVEGQTELIFITKLLLEIASEKNIAIQQEKACKKNGLRMFTVINAISNITNQNYFVLIRDCVGGSSVKSDIKESYKNLTKSNYGKILGLMDLAPIKYDDLSRVEHALSYGMPNGEIPIHILLSIMEIEAWFLAEVSHFSNIHPTLTLESIKSILQFDPENDNIEIRPEPAKDLNHVYSTAGFEYNKSRSIVQKTVDALDYDIMCLDVRNRVERLGLFLDHIDSFLE